jgi:hypothetical protein
LLLLYLLLVLLLLHCPEAEVCLVEVWWQAAGVACE